MKIQAISVQVGRAPTIVEVRNDVLNDYFELTDGPYIAPVPHPSGATAYLNEDPVGKGLPINDWATDIFETAGMLLPGQRVRGGIVIVGSPDDTGSDTDVPEALARVLCGPERAGGAVADGDLRVTPHRVTALVNSIRAWKAADPTSDEDWLAMMDHLDVIEQELDSLRRPHDPPAALEVATDTA